MSFFPIGLMGKSLDAFAAAENVTADNIANVNTPGASRQIAVLDEAPAIVGSPFASTHVGGTFGDGVVLSSVQRIHQDSYDALFRGASSSQNFFTVQQQQLNAVQSSFGDPNSGVGAQFTAFQTAINQLGAQSGSGSSTSVRQNVIQQAQALTNSLNNAANSVTLQKSQAIGQAGGVVVKVNGILDQIAALNSQIRASTAVGDNPNTFADQRDNLIDQLSQYISTQTSVQPNGSTLVSVNGQALVNDTIAYHLAPPVISQNPNGTPAFVIGFAGDANPAAPQPIPLGSGQLAGYQDLYNNKLTPYGQQLDNFAQSLSSEVNRITQAGYDQNGIAGVGLFAPIVGNMPISASNIQVGITTPSQLPAALATTAAGNLVAGLNSANNTVDTSAQLDNNASLANSPPVAGLGGTLSVKVDGVVQTFAYSTLAGGNSDTIDHFITSFNSKQFGVTASFDPTGQKIVFARDPANIDLVHRAAQQAAGTPTDPTFSISDSNWAAATPSSSLIGVLGANALQNGGGAVVQNSGNAFGANDNGAANAILKLFSANVGVPAIQTTGGSAVAAAGSVTITAPAAGAYANVQVGEILTVDAGTPNQENVVVTAINTVAPGSFTATFTQVHPAGFSISSAQVQTLGQYYGNLITQVGLDGQTANAGVVSQTALASSINTARQSVDGINLDEETQNLIKYQNAYQAAARTINVLDSLLNTVINSLGQ
ncbi:MAG: flagellar hook-associated protein FlgK [Candidatus Baltobacteraceae bacterium]